MALNSQRAAQVLKAEDPRSCASRIYYSAYQAITAVLLYRGGIPPEEREAWNHQITPDLILDQLEPLIKSLNARKDLSSRLSTLYKVRIIADYVGDNSVDETSIRKAMKDGNFLVKVATDLLPGA